MKGAGLQAWQVRDAERLPKGIQELFSPPFEVCSNWFAQGFVTDKLSVR